MHSIFEHPRKNAFSLVELSIVLVIIGLLVGGILAGRSLVRASELRSVTTEVSRHQTAIYAFRDKYFYLPGDFTNATSFWGSAGGDGSNQLCFDTDGGTKATCNGNGDGILQAIFDNGVYATYASEGLRAWQHLANAGLIEGTYNGVSYVPIEFGINAPKSKMARGGYALVYADGVSFAVLDTPDIGNYLFFGSALDTANGPILSPSEAWNLDTKMDDGKPTTGKVITDPDQFDCVTGTPVVYALSTADPVCSLRFRLK